MKANTGTCHYCETDDDAPYRPSHDEYICADCVRAIVARYGESFPADEIEDVGHDDTEYEDDHEDDADTKV